MSTYKYLKPFKLNEEFNPDDALSNFRKSLKYGNMKDLIDKYKDKKNKDNRATYQEIIKLGLKHKFKKQDWNSVATKTDMKMDDFAPRILKRYNEDESLNEAEGAALRKIMKAIKKFENPFSIAAIENNKVIDQDINIKDWRLIPAHYRTIAEKHPNASIEVEDGTGHIVA